MSPESPAATVVVVSWNTRELLDRCLTSLRADFEAGRAAVFVVDNGSTDGSPDLVRSEHQWVELIEPDENLGFGRAVNLAARQSESPWIAPANADIEVEPGAIEALIATGERHPEAGAIAPRLLLPDGSTQHSVHRFPSPSLSALFSLAAYRLSRRLGDRLLIEGYWDPNRPRQVDWALGAFLLARREIFDRAGGFDEEQWMYAEDIDLGWRLSREGHPVRYEPSARVHHAESAAARKAFTDFDRDTRHIAATYVWLDRRRGRLVSRLTGWLDLAGAAARYLLLTPVAALSERKRFFRDDARRYVALIRAAMRSAAGSTASTATGSRSGSGSR
jgi:N-acetylglucosaminyl-diphospho-decaprenol L-rhamnosyltransferase